MLLLLIIAGAFLVRLYRLEGTTLSNDELSGLTDLLYGGLKDIIYQGVRNDGHPAAVAVFLYFWTGLFGDSAYMVRLPFALMGVLSVLLTFSWVRYWFGRLPALLTAASMAFLQFPILYSQLARPYPAGLFLSMLLVWCWTHIIVLKKKHFLWYAGLVFSATACLYTHYFSFLFAVMVCLSGLIFISKESLKRYLLSGAAIIILYLPYLPIFFHQLNLGGLLWLGKPGLDFFYRHPFYILNDSWWVILIVASLVLYSVIRYKPFFKKLQLVAFAWFFLPLLIGWLKSYFGMPVLQNSVLLFSMPLFLALLFSFVWYDLSPVKNAVLVIILSISLIASLILEKDYYNTEHHAQFKPITKKILKWNDEYGEENIHRIINLNRSYYVKYYLRHFDTSTDFILYRTDNMLQVDSIFQLVDTSTRQYISLAAANIATPPVIDDIIRLKYPIVLATDSHFLSFATLYKADSMPPRPTPFKSMDPISGTSEKDFGGNIIFRIPFSDSLSGSLARVRSSVLLKELHNEIDIIASVEDSTGQIYSWNSLKLANIVDDTGVFEPAAWWLKLPEKQNMNDILKFYIWNRTKNSVQAKDFRVDFYRSPAS